MSDQDLNQPGDQQELETEVTQIPQEDELASLKKRAEFMGLKYHPSISVEKLRAKIAEHLAADTDDTDEVIEQPAIAPIAASVIAEDTAKVTEKPAVKAVENPETGVTVYSLNETPTQKRQRLRRWANEKVRVRIACMNPNKKDYQGEIFTVGNAAVGTVKEFVPFNNEEGWHVSRLILEAMQARECQTFINRKTKNGVTVREGRLIKEFAIEFLEPLTQLELNELARRQAMVNGQE